MKPWQQWLTLAMEWWRDNPSARRLSITAIVVIALVSLLWHGTLGRSPQVSLFDARELTRDEISLMQVAFGQSGLNEYEVLGSTIRIPRARRGEYLNALAEHTAIPPDLVAQQRSPSSFDVFQSRSQQRQQLLERKKQIIRDMVLQLGFVDKAIIEYDEARGSSPFADLQRTAIVTVRPIEKRTLKAADVKAIRDTVGGAFAGLSAAEITVIDTNANRSHTVDEHEVGENIPPHVAAKLLEENKYEQKIRSALAAWPDVRVNVEVAIDPVVRRVVDHRDIQGEPKLVSRTSQLETSRRMPRIAQPSIQMGTENFSTGANGQAQLGSDEGPWQHKTETTTSMANGTIETTESIGPQVASVSVSIGIPEQYVRYFASRTLASDSTAAADAPTIDRVFQVIRADVLQKVQPLIPLPASTNSQTTDQHPHIVVMMDHEMPTSPDALAPAPVATTWWNNLWTTVRWPLLGFLGLAIGASALLRPIGRNLHHGRPVGSSITEPTNAQPIQLEDFDTPPIAATLPGTDEADEHNRQAAQEDIRIQLDQWCRENPDAAAATIRQWLERAG